jgi:hypothetical protein
MKTLRILYVLARADFLERTRRYSFLLMLALVVWIGYLSASGQFRMRVPPDYTGMVNSAWVGATMTVTVSFLLGWVGFYIVKGSVGRDYTTGVGQIMATTPLSRPLYMLGKWLSNFAVLAIAVFILVLEGILMNLVLGRTSFNLLALAAPLVLIALPFMGLIAAFAVLFESVDWLRGGLGNLIYFFLFIAALAGSAASTTLGAPGVTVNPFVDFAGWQIIGDGISRAAQAAYPGATGGFAFSISNVPATKLFPWNGIQWTADIFLSRLFFILIALGLVMLSALFFDRFDSAGLAPMKKQMKKQVKKQKLSSDLAADAGIAALPVPPAHLTPLPAGRPHFRFDRLFMAELKLFLKGQRWWWYTIAIGLVIAQLLSGLEATRILLILAWIWPVLILGGLGWRESHFDTRQIVFSAPRPLLNQLPATWLSAFVVIALAGSGALVRFLLAGETVSVLGWITATIFIPSLAFFLGTLTGSSKAFEALYLLWMYLLTQKMSMFDFAGLTPQSPWFLYALLSLVLIALAAFTRQRQLRSG